MAELWTFSGINSLVDYVGSTFVDAGTQAPARTYVSDLGTGPDYSGSRSVLTSDSEARLDAEADAIAETAVDPGDLRGERVCALFVAPKTDTRPYQTPRRFDCVVFWSPYDPIPNQGIFQRDSLGYWRQWGTVYPVGASHSLSSFMPEAMPIVKQGAVREPGRAGGRRVRRWLPTEAIAPRPVDVIQQWLQDDGVGIVMVGHSQGANIAMSVLNRGLA